MATAEKDRAQEDQAAQKTSAQPKLPSRQLEQALRRLLTAMRDFWAEGTPEARREAALIARHAAPYIHPRLANVDQTIHERQQYVIYVPEPCATAEEWEAGVRAAGYGLTSETDV
jgi:hypothetical protein